MKAAPLSLCVVQEKECSLIYSDDVKYRVSSPEQLQAVVSRVVGCQILRTLVNKTHILHRKGTSARAKNIFSPSLFFSQFS